MMRTTLVHLRLHDGDLIRSFVFDTILSTNLENNSHAALEAELTGGEPVPRRPVSAHAIAQSLGMPYETVRGRVMTLLRLGLCERGKGGLVVPAEISRRPDHQEAMLEVHAGFLKVIHAMTDLGLDFAGLAAKAGVAPEAARARPAGEAPPPAIVVRLVMDFQIRHLAHVAADFGDIMRGLIWAAVLRANVRNLLHSQDNAWAYARQSTPPPDELRVPISIRMLSRELGVPYETVRRHTAALLEVGYVKSVPGKGVFVPAEAVTTEGLGRENPRQMLQFTRLVGDLTRLGFDFNDPR